MNNINANSTHRSEDLSSDDTDVSSSRKSRRQSDGGTMPTSLLTEQLGDGKVNCLEQAVRDSDENDELVFLSDHYNRDGNGAGHVIIRDKSTGRIWDPKDGQPPEDPLDWPNSDVESWNSDQKSNPFNPVPYRELGAVDANEVKTLLTLSPEQRSEAIEKSKNTVLADLDDVSFADQSATPTYGGQNGITSAAAPGLAPGTVPPAVIPGDAVSLAPNWMESNAGLQWYANWHNAVSDLKNNPRDQLPATEIIGSRAMAYIENGTRSIQSSTNNIKDLSEYLKTFEKLGVQDEPFLTTSDRTKIMTDVSAALNANTANMNKHIQEMVRGVHNDVKTFQQDAVALNQADAQAKKDKKLAVISLVASIGGAVASGGATLAASGTALDRGLQALGIANAATNTVRAAEALPSEQAAEYLQSEFASDPDFIDQATAILEFGEASAELKKHVEGINTGTHAAVIMDPNKVVLETDIQPFHEASAAMQKAFDSSSGAIYNFGRAAEKARATYALTDSLNSLSMDSSDENQFIQGEKLARMGWTVVNPEGADFQVYNSEGSFGAGNALVNVMVNQDLSYGEKRSNIWDGSPAKWVTPGEINSQRIDGAPAVAPTFHNGFDPSAPQISAEQDAIDHGDI
jgi:hypothetical protein